MKNHFQSKSVPRGTRTIWRYLSALFILFTFAIGNVWAEDVTVDLALAKNTDPSPSIGAIIGTNYSKSNFDGTGYKIGSDNNSIGWDISASGKTFTAVTFNGYINTTNTSKNWGFKFSTDGGTTWGSELTQSNDGTKSYHAISVTVAIPSGANAIQIIRKAGTSTYVSSITLTLASSIAAPAITAPTTDQSATYTVGDVITPLSVTATGSPTPTYQWYSNASASTTGATLITGAESASYTPSSAAESDLYFYCVATNSEGSAQSPYFHVKVNAAVATAPSFTSPASEPAVAEYFVGDVISALEVVAAGYPAPTLQWYSNSSKSTEGATLISGAESASYTPSNAAVSDLYFYCVATNASGTAQSEYFHVTVAAVSYCAELYPATSGASPTVANQEIILQTEAPNASFGGKIYTHSAKSGDFAASFTYTANGIQLNKGGDDKMRVELTHLMQVGTKITVTLVNPDASKARGFKLCNASGTAKATWQETTTDPYQKTYTVVAGDGLAGSNIFILQRAESSALKELKVSNCGAELLALSSAVTPAHDPAYATVTLSKNLVEAGGSATATYSIADPTAYDFDGWEITSGDATIADATAAEAAITMGTTASVITLKLKVASTKHTVTYYDGVTALGTELVVEGENPTAAEIVVPHKLGYAFAGWSTTDGGAVVALNTISVAADMPLYAVYNAVNCNALSGKIFEVNINVAPAANCTIRSGSGYETSADLIKYGTVSGGIAIAENSSTSNHLIITTTPTVKFAGGNGYVHISFDCALKVGDKIKTTIASQNIAYTTTSSRSTTNYFTKGTDQELTITSGHALENATEIYLWAASSNGGELTSLQVIRPEKFEVTFNMHGHGDAVDPQSVVEGGKVTKPTDPTASGWDFGGWFTDDTYGTTWDFENMTISAATEIHALWTVHTTSSDATLSSLTVNGVAITLEDGVFGYAFELPMGTTALPTIVAVANDPNSKGVSVLQTNIGSATITVTAEDDSFKVYTISFTVATSKDIELVWDKSKQRCDATTPAAVVKSDDATVSTYINKMTFTGGGEGSSLNVGNTAGNMVTLTAKPGYAISAMSFYGKIEADDAKLEYSLNGGAWTDLASTNAGDACYADVFTAAEVHELRMRSAGNKGFWIRNMQLTIIEACTPIVVAWDEEPVEFEVGKAGYAIAATANNGGTITYATADNTIIDVNASTGALTIAGQGSVALSASTPEGDGTTYCANGGDPIVLSKTVKTYYLVAFDGQNGEAADEVKYFSGDAAIDQPTDPSFPGHTFQGWFDAASAGNPVAFPLTPSASRTIYAQWTADCAGATITTQPEGTSYLTGRTAADLVCEATAGNGGALTYEWFTCDDAVRTNPVAATATPSTAVAGTFYYFCKVTEEGCAVEAFSDVATIVVADKDPICLIATTVTGATAHGAVTGFLGEDRGGDAEVNVTGGSYKMDKGKYIGVTLPEGYKFQEGDKVVLSVMTVNNATGFTLFDGKDGEKNLIIDTRDGALVPAGANTVVLPAYAGSQSVYVMRENNSTTGDLNSAIDAIAVYRACAPILNKVTVNGAEGKPNALKEVVFEVAASTTQAQLEAIAFDWVSNDDAWTASHAPVAANAWEFGVANEVTFTDKDGDPSVYTITVNKAAASTDATLSALSASAGVLNPAFDPAVLSYTVALPYGTEDVPTLSATKNHVGAAEPVIVDAAAFVNRKAVSTVTVTAEDGATELTYTVTFNVEKFPSTVIWDGSYMDAVATSPASGFTWTVTGFGSVADYNASCGTKAYTKCLPSGGSASATRNIALNVPEGYLAKFYIVFGTHSDGNNRGMFIASNATKKLEEATSVVLTLYSSSRTNLTAGTSEMVLGEGTWYIDPMESVDFYEISATLMPVGYQRNVTEGRMGTVCLPANVEAGYIYGAEVYTLLYWKYGTSYADCQMVDFEQVGEMRAGYPYMIIPTGNKFAVVYGDETYDGDGVHMANGFIGTINPIAAAPDNVLVGKYGIINNMVQKLGTNCNSPANRAYIDLSETPSKEEYEVAHPNPAPRKRVSLGHQGTQETTGLDEINVNTEKIEKVMVDGQMFIIRGGHIFDATGRLVK